MNDRVFQLPARWICGSDTACAANLVALPDLFPESNTFSINRNRLLGAAAGIQVLIEVRICYTVIK